MTPPQNMQALALANRVKLQRRLLKRQIKVGELTLHHVLEAEIPDWLAKMPVGELLLAPRRVRHPDILRALRQTYISELRPLGTIPPRQRRALLAALEECLPMLRRAS